MKPRLRSILLCDDVRQEISLKYIYIGAYADQVILSARPGKVNLVLACVFDNMQGGGTIEVQISLDGRKKVVTSDVPRGHAQVNAQFPVSLVISRPGNLELRWRIGTKWSDVYGWSFGFTVDAAEISDDDTIIPEATI